MYVRVELSIVIDSVADPGLFGNPDPEKNRIRVLKEQGIDQNHQKIIPKFSNRRLFFFGSNSVIWQYSVLK